MFGFDNSFCNVVVRFDGVLILESLASFAKYFGFEEAFKMPDSDRGPQTWGKIGETGMWIGGGYEKSCF